MMPALFRFLAIFSIHTHQEREGEKSQQRGYSLFVIHCCSVLREVVKMVINVDSGSSC